ncbi:hypothetical protein MSG28_004018, partial [Choristoneura fumiferana]
ACHSESLSFSFSGLGCGEDWVDLADCVSSGSSCRHNNKRLTIAFTFHWLALLVGLAFDAVEREVHFLVLLVFVASRAGSIQRHAVCIVVLIFLILVRVAEFAGVGPLDDGRVVGRILVSFFVLALRDGDGLAYDVDDGVAVHDFPRALGGRQARRAAKHYVVVLLSLDCVLIGVVVLNLQQRDGRLPRLQVLHLLGGVRGAGVGVLVFVDQPVLVIVERLDDILQLAGGYIQDLLKAEAHSS